MANRRISVARFPATPSEPAVNINIIDNGDGTVTLFVDDGLSQYSAPITATGAMVVGSAAGTVSGSGTTDVLPKWTNGSGSVLGDSRITDDGSVINIDSLGPIQIGDASLVGNSTLLTVADNQQTISLDVPVSGGFGGVIRLIAPEGSIELNIGSGGTPNGAVSLGDLDGVGNLTKLVLRDDLQTIVLVAANGVTVNGDPVEVQSNKGVDDGYAALDSAGNVIPKAGSGFAVANIQVVGAQEAAIPDAAGGVVIDIEARAALNALLAAVRAHGLIA
jgi:hypothetical protein